jgi:hypothetical protein
MAKEDVYTLEGKLVRKPKSHDSYARTRKAIAMKLANAKVNGEHMFARIGNLKLEDEKFTIPAKMNRGATFTGESAKYEEFSEEWRREFLVDDMLIELEVFLGIGKPDEEGIDEKTRKEHEEERRKRLAEMDKQGILQISHLTGFEEKDFEA